MLVSGAVRTTKVLDDGRRQVGAFICRATSSSRAGEEHPFCAEAITASTVVVVKRSALVALAGRDADAARQLWALTARELDLVRAHMMQLIRTARERVACFLIEMAHRQAASDRVELPMSRQDIADHLGPHDRDRLAYLHAARRRGHHRAADPSPGRAAQSRRARPPQQLTARS